MRIAGTTRLAGIMGWPVAHSRSPLLHGFWLNETGIDGAYLPLPVRPEHIGTALRALAVLGFRGSNLTIPHKQAALSVVDRVEPLARRIGAVNTTSLGMTGEPPLVLDLSRLPPSAPVVDIVYVPLETGLLAAARRLGHPVVDGLGMLLHQGRPGFEAWFGAPVGVTPELKAAILA